MEDVPVLSTCTGWSRRSPLPILVYRSSCRRWVTRTLGAVSSYTCVVWERWRVTVILAALFVRVVVWGMM